VVVVVAVAVAVAVAAWGKSFVSAHEKVGRKRLTVGGKEGGREGGREEKDRFFFWIRTNCFDPSFFTPAPPHRQAAEIIVEMATSHCHVTRPAYSKQGVAVCCSVLQCVAGYKSTLQCEL